MDVTNLFFKLLFREKKIDNKEKLIVAGSHDGILNCQQLYGTIVFIDRRIHSKYLSTDYKTVWRSLTLHINI